jgi:hypothetical protein
MSIFKKIGRWAKRRATEGSTITGVSIIIAGTIAPTLGIPVDDTAQLIAIGLGGLLAGATTANHTPIEELPRFSR